MLAQLGRCGVDRPDRTSNLDGQERVEVAGERNSALVMPVPVELLRFFDKFTPSAAAGERKPAADSASLADFGTEDAAEAEIVSGAPLQIPDVPAIPELPVEVSGGKLAAGAGAADHAGGPEPDAVAGHDDDDAGAGR